MIPKVLTRLFSGSEKFRCAPSPSALAIILSAASFLLNPGCQSGPGSAKQFAPVNVAERSDVNARPIGASVPVSTQIESRPLRPVSSNGDSREWQRNASLNGAEVAPATSHADLSQVRLASVQLAEPLPEPLPVPSEDAISLDALESLALANNPTLRQAQMLVRQEEGLFIQAGKYPNPTAGYVRTDPDARGQSSTRGVFLSQEFVTAGKRRLAQAWEANEIEWRSWQLNAQQQRVVNDVRIRYYEALGAQRLVKETKELKHIADQGLDVTNRLLKAGEGRRSDILQAEIQVQAIQAASRAAEQRQRTAWQQLVAVVGLLDLAPMPLKGELEGDLPEFDYGTGLEQLLATSPLLQSQTFQIEATRRQVDLAMAQRIPNVTVQVVAERDVVQNFSSVSSLVAMPIPIFNRNQGNIINLQAQLRQQIDEYERIKLALADQFSTTYQRYATLRDQTRTTQEEILPRAKENLDLTTKAYAGGEYDFLRVLSAQQFYFSTKSASIESLRELHQVGVELSGLLLTGGLNPTEIGTALQSQAGGASTRSVLLQQLQEGGAQATNLLPGAIQAGP